jgi:hypothetical protein
MQLVTYFLKSGGTLVFRLDQDTYLLILLYFLVNYTIIVCKL